MRLVWPRHLAHTKAAAVAAVVAGTPGTGCRSDIGERSKAPQQACQTELKPPINCGHCAGVHTNFTLRLHWYVATNLFFLR